MVIFFFFYQLTFIIITIISIHLYSAILLRYRVEIIILSCLIDLNFLLPIGIYHLTLQFSENHLTIHSRENRKQSNDGRLENVLRFQSPIFRIHTCIRIRPFLSNDGKLHVWRRQGFSQQHDYNFFLQSAMNFERSNLDNTGAGFQSATDRWGFCPIVIRSNQRATVLIVSLLVLFSLFSIDNYNCAIIVFN